MNRDPVVSRLVNKAMRTRTAGKTVAERVTQLAGQQKQAARSILLRGLKRGDAPATLAKALERFYASAPGGAPAYQARRLVQSEMTRFQGRVVEQLGRIAASDTSKVPVFVYRSQRDHRVRNEHAVQDGGEYTLGEFSSVTPYPPIDEAQAILGEPNCRCWLDLARWEALTARAA